MSKVKDPSLMSKEELLGEVVKSRDDRKKYWRKAQIKKELLETKCAEAGIAVTSKEVDEEYKRKYGK